MTIRDEAVSKLFESIAVETPASVRDRARALSGKFLESKGALPLAPGDVAGSYEVLSVLGSGGQAVVYLAQHQKIGRSVAASVLRALAFAHRSSVVHRDVKPANILFDKNGEPKVADFGIGTMSAADGLSVSVELSQLSLLAGTPLYVAPEQENPDLRVDGRLDGRADLFSFGKVLFQMLTGASPRTIRPPTRLRKGLDPAWDEFVFKLLEERPQDRFASAEAALAALPGEGSGGAAPAPAPPAAAPPAPARPLVVVQPRDAEAARAPEARPETPAQRAARLAAQVMAALYFLGLWFAVASEFVAWDHFLPTLYAGAFATACGFSLVEAKRASRARDPGILSALLACLGAGLAFVGSVAGIHAAMHAHPNAGLGGRSWLSAEELELFREGRERALEITLFLTLPVQALGLVLAWLGHRELAPSGENAPTREELALVDRLLGTLTLILYGLTALSFAQSDPVLLFPVCVTLSIGLTYVTLQVTRARRRSIQLLPAAPLLPRHPAGRRIAHGLVAGLVCAVLVLPIAASALYVKDMVLGHRSRQGLDVVGDSAVIALGFVAIGLELVAVALAVQGLIAIARRPEELRGRSIAWGTLAVAALNVAFAAVALVILL